MLLPSLPVAHESFTELVTTDTNAAEKFYTQLFGWSAKTGTDGGTTPPYTEFSVGGGTGAGMMAVQPEWGKVPPHWTPYFQVTDCDATDTQQAMGRAP